MADTTFSNGTLIVPAWLQDVNDGIYRIKATGIGAVNRTLQAKLQEFISVKDYGAVGNGVTDDTAAIIAANAAATAANCALRFPLGTYIYNPSAALNIAVRWEGDSAYQSQITVSSSYAGEVFRLLTQAEMGHLAIVKSGLTKTAGSIGVRICGTTLADWNVSTAMRRVYIRGFDKGLDVQNAYVLNLEQVHCENNNEGFYCAADISGGGFITTHNHVSCTYANNTRNLYYSTPNYSEVVTFTNCIVEGATGATQQAFITKLRVFKWIGGYFEGAPTIKGLALGDVTYASIDGCYFNGTGGLSLGSTSEVEFRNVWTTSATDVLTGADGTNYVRLFGCLFPSVGNSAATAWKQFIAQSSRYNGIRYENNLPSFSGGFKDTQQSGGGTLTLDMANGNLQRVTVIDSTAFTLGAPLNAVPGMPLKLIIQNSAGAPMGAITWNAIFKKTSFTNPATGNNRTICFNYDGSSWFEEKNTADVPN